MTRGRRLARPLPVVAFVLFAVPPSGVAQEIPAPVDRQVLLLTKVLQFDRAFHDHSAEADVVVAVVYQTLFQESLSAHHEVVTAFEAHPQVAGRRVRVVPVVLDPSDSIEDELIAMGASVAYIAPLRAVSIEEILDATRELDILSVTGVPDYVADGVSVGISVRGERPEILINRSASVEEGARFAADLLGLARIVETVRHPDG